mgnify:CR=1 FL=1
MKLKIQSSFARRRSAFTLVEMLLVLVIIGTLAAIVIPKIAGRGEDARIKAAGAQIASFGTALRMFEVDNGFYPKGKDGLNQLLQAPQNAPGWKGPYLESVIEVPRDPWGNPYVYECPGKHNPSGYDLMSAGPDGRADPGARGPPRRGAQPREGSLRSPAWIHIECAG